MKIWSVWSGGPCEKKYAGRDEPEKYHELALFEVAWYWLFAEWVWDSVRAALDHIPLPSWPKVRIDGSWESPREYYGSLGDLMQSVGDPVWQRIVRHTLAGRYELTVRVSCDFFNSTDGSPKVGGGVIKCECGYQPRAPERHPPVTRFT